MTKIEDKIDEVKEKVEPVVEQAVTWRDWYLSWVTRNPKAVSIILAVVTVWAAFATLF
jgi:hypothetical protein